MIITREQALGGRMPKVQTPPLKPKAPVIITVTRIIPPIQPRPVATVQADKFVKLVIPEKPKTVNNGMKHNYQSYLAEMRLKYGSKEVNDKRIPTHLIRWWETGESVKIRWKGSTKIVNGIIEIYGEYNPSFCIKLRKRRYQLTERDEVLGFSTSVVKKSKATS